MGVVDYALHCMITEFLQGGSLSLRPRRAGRSELQGLHDHRPNYYMDDATPLRLLKQSARIGGLVVVHAENDAIVTEETEQLVRSGARRGATTMARLLSRSRRRSTACCSAEAADAPVYIVHCSTARSVELVRRLWAGRRGLVRDVPAVPAALTTASTRAKTAALHPSRPSGALGEPESVGACQPGRGR